MNNTVDKDKCQSIYLNLIESLRKPGLEIGPLNYIRAFNQTVICDKFDVKGAVKARRKDYIDYLGDDRYQRIVQNGSLSKADQEAAADVVFHYKTDNIRVLSTVLYWPNYFYYHVVTRSERTLVFAAITVVPIWVAKTVYINRLYIKSIFKRIF